MEIRLLGPVSLWRDGHEVALTRSHRRCVLAVLALNPGHPVSTEALIDRVWGDDPPSQARHSLHAHVSAVRRLLEQGDTGEIRLRRQDGGYTLEIDPGRIDLSRARRLAEQARTHAAAAADTAALDLLRQACGLWRGVPLSGLASEWAGRLRDGLDQERLALLVERFTLELKVGEHATAVGPLSELLADYPLVEPLAGLQMLALYRCGRQPEALALYARTRQRLIDEIGDDPGAELQQLHEQILRRDPVLELLRTDEPAALPTASAPPPLAAEPTQVPAQLPASVATFTGRDQELAMLDSLLLTNPEAEPTSVAVALLSGAAGVGKSALAVNWAHRSRHHFPDGQLYVNLRGHAPDSPQPPLAVLASFLRALGVPANLVPTQLDDAAALFRSTLADRRVLVLLDDAADAAQVRPLVPGAAGSVVLVTSRGQLPGLVAQDGARSLPVSVLATKEASELLERLLEGKPGVDSGATAELARLCGNLPLALRVAAANLALPGREVGEYLRELRESDRLAALSVPGDPDSAVARALGFSYARLAGPTRQMFRLLGLIPGEDLNLVAAAHLASATTTQARRLLEELCAAHLVEQPTPGRYRCHDLVRQFAASLAVQQDSAAEVQAARSRLYDFYLGTARAVAQLAFPQALRLASDLPAPAGVELDRPDVGLAWLDTERTNLVATVHDAAANGAAEQAWMLADALRGYFWLRMCTAEWEQVARTAVAAAERAGNLPAQAAGQLSMANLCARQSRHVEAVHHAKQAQALASSASWLECEASALGCLGTSAAARGEATEAIDAFQRALSLCARTGWLRGQATVLTNLGSTYVEIGQLAEASHYNHRALAMNTELGSINGQAVSLINLGTVHHLAGRPDDAIRCLTDAAKLCETLGSRSGLCASQRWLSSVHLSLGQLDTARQLAGEALALARAYGHRQFESDALNQLATVDAHEGRLVQAAQHFRHALAIAAKVGHDNPSATAEAHFGLAEVLVRQGQLETAQREAGRGLVAARRAGALILEANALTMQARICLLVGEDEQAQAYGVQALALHRSTGHRLGEIETERMLAQAQAQMSCGTARRSASDGAGPYSRTTS